MTGRSSSSSILTDASYVMQAYSQIVDPDLSLRRDSAGSGRHPDQIGLPDGWRYRTRKPDENLVLRANGTATIIQDALKNTYQRLPKRYGA